MLTKMGHAKLTIPARNVLFWAGAAAALLAALIFRRNLGAEYSLLHMLGIVSAGPETPPAMAADWFNLLQENRFLGLVFLNFFDCLNYLLFGVMLLALFAALRRSGEALMFAAAGLGFAGVVIFLASNQALALVSLADQYVYAPGEAQRQLLLAAGQGVLAVNFRESYASALGGGLYVSFLFVSLSGLFVSIVMLKNKLFGRAAAILGILANAFGLGYYLLLLISPGLIALTISISSVFLLAWYVMIAVRFFRSGRTMLKAKEAALPQRRRGRR